MACYPTHCTFNCFSDNCVLNAPTCPTNETNFGAAVIIGDIILASHTNTLRASIDEERVRRGYAEDFSTTVDSDDDIEQQHMVDMKTSIYVVVTDIVAVIVMKVVRAVVVLLIED